MGVDYILEYSCDAKREYGLNQVAALSKLRSNYYFFKKLIAEGKVDPKNPLPSTRITPSGTTENAPLTFESMEAIVKQTAKYDSLCASCPANVQKSSGLGEVTFGCKGFIRYPISEIAERVLFGLAVAYLKDLGEEKIKSINFDNCESRLAPAGIIRLIWDENITGEKLQKVRGLTQKAPEGTVLQGGNPNKKGDVRPLFFELTMPLEHKYGPILSKKVFTSNQLFESLLWKEKYTPDSIMKNHLPFLNLLEMYLQRLSEKERERVETDDTIVGLRIFRNALASAVSEKSAIISNP